MSERWLPSVFAVGLLACWVTSDQVYTSDDTAADTSFDAAEGDPRLARRVVATGSCTDGPGHATPRGPDAADATCAWSLHADRMIGAAVLELTSACLPEERACEPQTEWHVLHDLTSHAGPLGGDSKRIVLRRVTDRRDFVPGQTTLAGGRWHARIRFSDASNIEEGSVDITAR